MEGQTYFAPVEALNLEGLCLLKLAAVKVRNHYCSKGISKTKRRLGFSQVHMLASTCTWQQQNAWILHTNLDPLAVSVWSSIEVQCKPHVPG